MWGSRFWRSPSAPTRSVPPVRGPPAVADVDELILPVGAGVVATVVPTGEEGAVELQPATSATPRLDPSIRKNSRRQGLSTPRPPLYVLLGRIRPRESVNRSERAGRGLSPDHPQGSPWL